MKPRIRALALLTLVGGALAACAEPRRPTGVVLIVVDTFRADRLAAYDADRIVLPNLDRRSARAAVYRHSFASSSWTLPAMASLMTGLDPASHGADARILPDGGLEYRTLRPDIPTLAETLSTAGVRTAAVVNNPWLRPESTLGRGFEIYDYAPSDNRQFRRAGEVFARALSLIRQFDGEPFWILIHLLDPHMDYDPPAAVAGRFSGQGGGTPEAVRDLPRLRRGPIGSSERASVTARYDEELAAVDLEVDRFLEHLRGPDSLAPEALVILTADHGEELWDHGGFEHGHALFDEVVRVPLLVWGPGVRPGRRDSPVSSPDIGATVLDVLRADPRTELEGRSLWPDLRGDAPPPARPLPVDGTLYGTDGRALVDWPLKLVARDGNPPHLYDLVTDPREREDLCATRPAECDRLLRRLEPLNPSPAGGLRPGAEDAEALRSLGYLD